MSLIQLLIYINNELYMRKLIIVFLFGLIISGCSSTDFVFRSKTDLQVSISPDETQVVQTALDILAKDYQHVFDGKLVREENRNTR